LRIRRKRYYPHFSIGAKQDNANTVDWQMNVDLMKMGTGAIDFGSITRGNQPIPSQAVAGW